VVQKNIIGFLLLVQPFSDSPGGDMIGPSWRPDRGVSLP
jgi:hypothetical protein